VSTGTPAFRTAYVEALAAFLEEREERHLRAAYELGREAVMSELSVLDLAVIHHDALGGALAKATDAEAVAGAAGDFFLEALSAYEMVRRGFREAREAAALERRQAELLRQLSNFLADASLALGASDSLEEMLQLVAEQTRELIDAEECVVSLDLGGARRVEAVSSSDVDTWSRPSQAGGPVLEDEVAERPPHTRRTMSEPLTTLDGRSIGSIQVLARDFTELDAAVLAQLAQMASAAVERRRLYPGA
jgi:hypothetical protein